MAKPEDLPLVLKLEGRIGVRTRFHISRDRPFA
jgi:hypothetical protein